MTKIYHSLTYIICLLVMRGSFSRFVSNKFTDFSFHLVKKPTFFFDFSRFSRFSRFSYFFRFVRFFFVRSFFEIVSQRVQHFVSILFLKTKVFLLLRNVDFFRFKIFVGTSILFLFTVNFLDLELFCSTFSNTVLTFYEYVPSIMYFS